MEKDTGDLIFMDPTVIQTILYQNYTGYLYYYKGHYNGKNAVFNHEYV